MGRSARTRFRPVGDDAARNHSPGRGGLVHRISPRRYCRHRRERGAALVEFALVFPLLFMLVAGMIDFGMVFSNLNSTRQGVREGARQAVVADFGNDTACPIVGAAPVATTKKLMC